MKAVAPSQEAVLQVVFLISNGNVKNAGNSLQMLCLSRVSHPIYCEPG